MKITVSDSRGSISITGQDINGNTVTEVLNHSGHYMESTTKFSSLNTPELVFRVYQRNWIERILWRMGTWLKLHRPFPTVVYIHSGGEEHDSHD